MIGLNSSSPESESPFLSKPTHLPSVSSVLSVVQLHFSGLSGVGDAAAAADFAPKDAFKAAVVEAPPEGAFPQAGHFLEAVGGQVRTGFLALVHAERTEEKRQAEKAAAAVLQAEEQVPVQGVVEGGVKPSALLIGRRADEEGFLGDEVHPAEGFGIGVRQQPASDFRPVFINDEAVPIDGADVRVGLKRVADTGEGAGQAQVVGVEPGENIPRGGLEGLEAADDGIGLARIRGGNGKGQPVAVAPEDFRCGVGGAAVLHAIVEAGVVLPEQAEQGGFQEPALLIGWGDDAETQGGRFLGGWWDPGRRSQGPRGVLAEQAEAVFLRMAGVEPGTEGADHAGGASGATRLSGLRASFSECRKSGFR